jgi:hypothetical protein
MVLRRDGVVGSSTASQAAATCLLLTMLALSIAGLVVPRAQVCAGAVAWAAAAFMATSLPRRQQAVAGSLLAIGLASLAGALTAGEQPQWSQLVSENQPLITLLVAVSFLRLAASPAPATDDAGTWGQIPVAPTPAPRGRKAVLQTTALVHLLGAIINISIIEIVGDRLLGPAAPQRRQRLLLLSRSYSSGAFWSPFWGATAAAVTYAPHAHFLVLLVVGGTAAFVAMAVSSVFIVRDLGCALDEFTGFPLSRQTLLVPFALTALLLTEHAALRGPSIPQLIAVTAPALTVVILLSRHPGRKVTGLFLAHARNRLPAMHSEITLFLAAGVVATGVGTLARSAGWVPFHSFTAVQALIVLVVMVIASMAGIHPVIMIGIAAAFLRPLDPNPTLFAMTCLFAWGIQGAGGPLSGLNIILQSRFGDDSLTIARWNARYVLGILGLAVVLLPLCQSLDGLVS